MKKGAAHLHTLPFPKPAQERDAAVSQFQPPHASAKREIVIINTENMYNYLTRP